MNAKFSAALLLSLTALLGCTAETADQAQVSEDEASDMSTSTKTFVALRHDNRKCVSPMCGGYFVKDLNKNTAEQYVSKLDFKYSKLSAEAIEVAQSAPAAELVVYGKLGPKENKFKTRTFLVYGAYRGMPGITATAGAAFYKTADRSPRISCFTAPCPNETASKLNSSTVTYFDRIDMTDAAKPFVDQDWLLNRALEHNAIVAGSFVKGNAFPGGSEKLLDVSQVFLSVDKMTGPCPAFKIAACADPNTQIRPYVLTNDLCSIPEGDCELRSACPSKAPAHCAEGYAVSMTRFPAPTCEQFSCVPAFVLPTEPEVPACNYNDPARTYVGQSLQACMTMKFMCPADRSYFSDDCGCGCQL